VFAGLLGFRGYAEAGGEVEGAPGAGHAFYPDAAA